RQGPDLLVELAPRRQPGRVVRGIVRSGEPRVGAGRGGVASAPGGVVCPLPLRAVVVLDQVEQFAADVQGRQAEEVQRGLHRYLLEGAVQADDGVLQHVVGLLPAADVGVALEDLAGEVAQALAGAAEEVAARRLVAAAEAVEAGLDLHALGGCLGHATSPGVKAADTFWQVRQVTVSRYPLCGGSSGAARRRSARVRFRAGA